MTEPVIVGPPNTPLRKNIRAKEAALRKTNRTKEKTKEKYNLWRARPAFFSLAINLPAHALPSPLLPKSQRNHPPHPRIAHEGKHRRSGAHIKHQPHGRSLRRLLLRHFGYFLLHDPCFARLRGTPGDDVGPGLALAGAAPPASVGIDLVDLVVKIRSYRCVAGQELVEPSDQLLSDAT